MCSDFGSSQASPSPQSGDDLQDTLLAYGQMVVMEQENVRRVQLANEYLSSAALAGQDGSSLPEEVTR